jgi:hypothetical protein
MDSLKPVKPCLTLTAGTSPSIVVPSPRFLVHQLARSINSCSFSLILGLLESYTQGEFVYDTLNMKFSTH